MSKTIQFVEREEPVLKSGEYFFKFEQKSGISDDSSSTLSKEIKAFVIGERFAFSDADFNSVYPPDMGEGQYSLTLPHVVLNKRTLPWERSAGGERGGNSPWLALFLFNDDDNPPEIIEGKASDLTTTEDRVSYGNLTFNEDAGESKDTPCLYCDIPIKTFKKAAPAIEDLGLLAHYRKIKQENMEELEHAVVICNQYAKKGVSSHVYLFSLENMGEYLVEPSKLDPFKTIRLVVFKSWQFYSTVGDDHFKEILDGLNVSSLYYKNEKPSSPIEETLKKGYVALKHVMRDGKKTVSWYRGPLSPYRVSIGDADKAYYSCSDAANHYDHKTGLFNVSYGVAWQLGQLIALNSPNFATSFYNWRKKMASSQLGKIEFERILKKLCDTHLKNIHPEESKEDQESEEVDALVDWIAELRLLKGVPFRYLVPDESMLPPNSIRFFYFDPKWVEALLDGALSIGRTTSEREREALDHLRDQSRKHLRDKYGQGRKFVTSGLSGCLLHSKAVGFGPRLIIEADGTEEYGKNLPLLRSERFSDEILFCLFSGEVDQIRMHEPPERLHFGVKGSVPVEQKLPIKKLAGNDNSAEFATKWIKGVVNVQFKRG